MKTMELETQKAMLVREILNTDDSELLKEMSNAYHRIKARMQKDAALKQDVKEYARQEEESCSSVVSEPVVGYGLKEVRQAKATAKKAEAEAVQAESEPEPDSKEYILKGLKEAFLELREIRAGRKSDGRPLREVLKELEAEEEE